jgi:hypothetical protein
MAPLPVPISSSRLPSEPLVAKLNNRLIFSAFGHRQARSSDAWELVVIQSLRYVSEVICSDTNPTRKMMTDALISNMLMLVSLCAVTKVYP